MEGVLRNLNNEMAKEVSVSGSGREGIGKHRQTESEFMRQDRRAQEKTCFMTLMTLSQVHLTDISFFSHVVILDV